MRSLAAPIALVALLDSGCLSLWAVSRPPSAPIDPAEPLDCTQAPIAPVIDTAVAALFAYATVALLTSPSSAGSNTGTGAVIAAIPAVLSGTSAVVGYRSTARCRELDDIVSRCLAGEREACGELRGPGAPRPAAPVREQPREVEPEPPPPEAPRRIEPQPPPPMGFAPARDRGGEGAQRVSSAASASAFCFARPRVSAGRSSSGAARAARYQRRASARLSIRALASARPRRAMARPGSASCADS